MEHPWLGGPEGGCEEDGDDVEDEVRGDLREAILIEEVTLGLKRGVDGN